MELRISKHNMTAFPIYMDLLIKYPKIVEIHLWSQWNHGYFGSSYDSYAEINGIRLSRRKFDALVYHGIEWKEVVEFLEQFR